MLYGKPIKKMQIRLGGLIMQQSLFNSDFLTSRPICNGAFWSGFQGKYVMGLSGQDLLTHISLVSLLEDIDN